MKKHFVIFVIVFLVTIGFAAANTVLDVTGSLNVAENIEDFKIEITNLKINNNDSKTLISKDKQSFTFTGSGNDTLEYTVTNYSYQYDASIVLTCIPSDNITVEQINNLPAQSKNSKVITSTNTNEITCTITVEKISRIDYAEDMCLALEETEWTFDYTGAEQEFTVPCDGNYKIETWGASGRNNGLANSYGRGGYAVGNISLKKQLNIYFYVGGVGGYNGGGGGECAGGGATDIRLEDGTWNNFNGLKSRIMVAAGGGGCMFTHYATLVSRGDAGGLNGITANATIAPAGVHGTYHANGYSGGGATQISGGKTGSYGYDAYEINMNGAFGQGGYYAGRSSGGGGGYYGGGHGRHPGGSWSGGGGGSSFISGHNGCDAIAENSIQTNIIHTGQPNHYSGYIFSNTEIIDGAGYKWTNVKGEQTVMPTHDGKSTMTGNDGNGYAKITYLGK